MVFFRLALSFFFENAQKKSLIYSLVFVPGRPLEVEGCGEEKGSSLADGLLRGDPLRNSGGMREATSELASSRANSASKRRASK